MTGTDKPSGSLKLDEYIYNNSDARKKFGNPACAKYRKKPVVIEAIHASRLLWMASNDFWKMPKWAIDAYGRGELLFANHPSRIEIKTLEGTMTADPTDMVICGVKGEIYPCKPDVFAATYEYAEE